MIRREFTTIFRIIQLSKRFAPAEEPFSGLPEWLAPAEEPLTELPERLAPMEEPLTELSEPLAPAEEPFSGLSEWLAPMEEPLTELSEWLAPAEEPLTGLSERLAPTEKRMFRYFSNLHFLLNRVFVADLARGLTMLNRLCGAKRHLRSKSAPQSRPRRGRTSSCPPCSTPLGSG